MTIESCEKFAVNSRIISCIKGKVGELVSIRREEGYSPTQADAMARYLVQKLNKDKDFDKFYQKYMETPIGKEVEI